MTAQTSMLHVRIDDKLKAEASEKLADLGLIPTAAEADSRGLFGGSFR